MYFIISIYYSNRTFACIKSYIGSRKNRAFYRLLSQILNSSDIKKLQNVNMREIKTLIENFKIKNEIFRESKYHANFNVYFNKRKIKFFLEKKKLILFKSKKNISFILTHYY